MKWDVFLSHASEDKDDIVRPLALLLTDAGLRVWYDEMVLLPGHSLRRKIDEGLGFSRCGLVVLSEAFFKKEWPQRELDGLTSAEIHGDGAIIPLWHNVSPRDVARYSPVLADRVGISTSLGLLNVLQHVQRALDANGDRARNAAAWVMNETLTHVLETSRFKRRFADGYEERLDVSTVLRHASLNDAVEAMGWDTDYIGVRGGPYASMIVDPESKTRIAADSRSRELKDEFEDLRLLLLAVLGSRGLSVTEFLSALTLT